MKLHFSTISMIFVTSIMVASLVIPLHLATPHAASADPGIMKWDTVATPGYMPSRYDVVNPHVPNGSNNARGSEVLDVAVGSDGKSVAAAVRIGNATNGTRSLLYSKDNGITWQIRLTNVYQVIPTTGNPNYLTATVGSDVVGAGGGPKRVVCSTNGGYDWDTVFNGAGLEANETIRSADVSPDYGGKHDIAMVTVGGANGGRWIVRSSGIFSYATAQMNPNGITDALGAPATAGFDYFAVKFSPTYAGDSAVALVYATDNTSAGGGATYYNVVLRDINANTTREYAFPGNGIEVRNPAAPLDASPASNYLNMADLQIPNDFSGQSASLRRAYISLDAYGSGGLAPAAKLAMNQDGIYRIDDTTQYLLMDTSAMADKSIYSIAYYGTYASGKLLAGERTGYPCAATVPTWFTDSPTTCPIPCWYPALKPVTGAANQGTCLLGDKNGMGAAQVDWNADGSLAFAATGSLPATVYAGQTGWRNGAARVSVADRRLWFQMQTWNPVANDESAFAISRNNGETWNELSIIDTTIDWFNDVAVSPDCTTIYLASANRDIGTPGVPGICNEFDSVWRSSINPNVTSPLPAIPPLGAYWERVYCRVTAGNCMTAQTDLPILRVVPSCTDKPDGEIVGWAAQGATSTAAGTAGVMAWSPDFGDYWANITPRYIVQDFAFESSTTMYIVNQLGLVQRLPYTGTSWSTNLPGYATDLEVTHTIVAVPDGKVLVGAGSGSSYPASYSADKGVSFSASGGQSLVGHGNEHVIFDVDFKNNSFVYMADDNFVGASAAPGTVYRNTVPSWQRWSDNDMMSAINGSGYIFQGVVFGGLANWTAATQPPHPVGQFGLAQAWTGDPMPALYSAHDNITNSIGTWRNSAVCRTLKPREGMPKPGIVWDCLDIFAPLDTLGVLFTLEPTSLKYCGCCTLDTNTTLYAIDDERGAAVTTVAPLNGRWNNHLNNPALRWDTAFPGYTPNFNQGMLWAYTDCLAKKGPILKTPADQYLVGADPVTGRNQQVDLSWEQLCLSTVYQLQIAKDAVFSLRINPALNNPNGAVTAVTGSMLLAMDATNMTSPAAWIAPGALPEAGAIYYWRIRSAKSATQQIAASPWSEVRRFTVKAGFIVNTPYYGVQLLAPNNSCTGCKVKPSSFSWSPWKEATKYQFDLATDPEFKSLVVTAATTTTGYEYSGTLNYSTNYFWRVKALEVNGQNIPSDWSATFSFETEPAPAPPAEAPAEPPIPLWVWVLIAIGAILVIVTLILVFKTRRRY